jgi:cytoskeletal protein CcmA (bactofilin family)
MRKKSEKQITAFLGRETAFEGKLTFSGSIRIDGRFKGEISEGDTVIIGETAIIESDIHVSEIIISGEVRGDIFAKKRIEIHSPARVYGNIQAPTVSMDAGVVFEGNCHIKQEERKLLGQGNASDHEPSAQKDDSKKL